MNATNGDLKKWKVSIMFLVAIEELFDMGQLMEL